MKKALIALAAVAVAGAASAQVTISGKIGFGYSKDSSSKGYEMTDGALTFAGSEDLGGGLKAGFNATIDNALKGRQASTMAGADATMNVTSGPLTVTMGSFESAEDAMRGDVSGISAEVGNDVSDTNLGAVNVDGIVVNYAAGNGLTLGVSHTEGGSIGDANATEKVTKVTADYTVGALTAFASFADYSVPATTNSVTSMAFTYDLGVAKVGYGIRSQSGVEDSSLISVNVPAGKFDFGVSYTEFGSVNTTMFGANYALSKRTKVQASVQSSNDADLDNSYRVKVTHSF